MDLARFFIIDILTFTSVAEIGLGPPGCGQSPHSATKICCKLLADNSTHLADGLHTADQILLHSHSQIPPKIKVVSGWGLRIVGSPRILQKVFAFLTRR